MANPIRNFASKKRKRYIDDGYNLDLSYITTNLIAMGFPSEKFESIYRNHIDDVARLFEDKHKDHYKIYNLCSEKSYDINKFHKRVAEYPFNDHNPPKIELIHRFCEDVHQFLSKDSKNVAAVHCKAGKGRTGTMICCYLLYIGNFKLAIDALNFYGSKRTHDLKGVTIPSQRRYVEYYASLLNMSRNLRRDCLDLYKAPSMIIIELTMEPPPNLNGGQGTLEFCVYENNQKNEKVSLGDLETRKDLTGICMRLDRCTPLTGDIKVEVYNNSKIKIGRDKLFHFWINTYFVKHQVSSVKEDSENGSTYKLTFDKWQLDDAHKDTKNSIFTPDFKVHLLVQFIPDTSVWGTQASIADPSHPSPPPPSPPSPSSSGGEDESDESLEPEESWDSAVEGGTEETGKLLGDYRLLSEPDLDNITNNTSITINTTSQPESERMLHA